MNIIMFIVGALIFTSFIIGIVWEARNEEKPQTENYENYGGTPIANQQNYLIKLANHSYLLQIV